jgi:mRNA interferase MazF
MSLCSTMGARARRDPNSCRAEKFLPRSVVIVAATSRTARAASFRPEAEVAGKTDRILVEQIGAVNAERLGELTGHLTHEQMWGVDDALLAVLGLS